MVCRFFLSKKPAAWYAAGKDSSHEIMRRLWYELQK